MTIGIGKPMTFPSMHHACCQAVRPVGSNRGTNRKRPTESRTGQPTHGNFFCVVTETLTESINNIIHDLDQTHVHFEVAVAR